MCGITGYWTRDRDPSAWAADLSNAVASLRRRGPDDEGAWLTTDQRAGLGHTRLSILDLSPDAAQPMAGPSGTVISFNGEIYNFKEIRARLRDLGYTFRTSGDTEVLLAAFDAWGIEALQQAIGMFAIALWDGRRQRLWLIRDRLGVKPLYYGWNGKTLWFGSELRALCSFRSWIREIDNEALGEFFQYGYISAPKSIYRDVSKLLPGHWLELTADGVLTTRPYWTGPDTTRPLHGSDEQIEDELEHLLIDAARHRMVSDVPVGVFLSGGLDSSLVTALLQRHSGQQVRTFTIGFREPQFDESNWARQVAQHLGTEHTEQIVSATDLAATFERWPDLFDEPFADQSGAPTMAVASLAREHVKVALSADGGDELFSGYQQYSIAIERQKRLGQIPYSARKLASGALNALPPEGLRRILASLPLPPNFYHGSRRTVVDRLDRLRMLLPQATPGDIYDGAMSFWSPTEIAQLVGNYARPANRDWPTGVGAKHDSGRCFATEMSLSDLRHYLPDDILTKVDRTTMSVGLEGREPLLDHRLVEFALRLPLHLRRGSLGSKHILRRILYRYVKKELIDRPKQGFAVPLGQWLRNDLSHLLDEWLSPERLRELTMINPDMARTALHNFRAGGEYNDRIDLQKVWTLLVFSMWHGKWMQSHPTIRTQHSQISHYLTEAGPL
jgi:asparagine synthase (glutamine-hydrolysing)